MTNIRQWADATLILIGRLQAAFPNVPVLPVVPTPRPDRMLVVRRVGGSHDGVLDQARMDIEVWSGTPDSGLAPVWELVGLVRETVRTLAGSGGISRVDERGVALAVDGQTGCPRVLLGVVIWLIPGA
jgi:hypothetical protein